MTRLVGLDFPEDPTVSVQVEDQIVSHVGASQYEAGGIASCGLAALNFVRVVLGKAESGLEGGRLLDDVLERKTSEEAISICAGWTSNAHLEVEEIFAIPLFERALALVDSTYGKPGAKRFREVLSDLQTLPKLAAVIITRPPEIITCLRLPIPSATTGQPQDVFIIFDSHPRSQHPEGSGLVINTSLDATAAHLADLLAVDDHLLADRSLQWQTQLLANFSGHFFVARSGATNGVDELTRGLMESSLVALGLQAEVAELKFRNSSLLYDRRVLKKDLDEVKEKYQDVKRKLEDAQRGAPSPTRMKRRDSQPSSSKKLPPLPPPSPTDLDAPQYLSSLANIIRSCPTSDSILTKLEMEEHRAHHAGGTKPKDDHSRDEDYMLAAQLQMDWDQAQRDDVLKAREKQRQFEEEDADHAMASQLQMDWDRAQRDDVLKVREKQRQFEEEDSRLIAERTALQQHAQPIFQCGVCFDKYPEDYVSRVAGCSHEFCRDCMKGYVVSKLTDKLYPIFCPMCVTDNARADPGMVTDDLIQTLGLDDKQYQTLQELQIASLSILLHCRKCKQSVFVDRTEYEAAPILVCPLPRCNYAWCKACQQKVPVNGSKHSCDGSSELEHLMKRRGWKHCPGCKTNYQRSSGCNHMTCMSPGCNTHFCYACGKLIVQSAKRREIKASVSAHYNRCNLFEDVADP
ncbi:hypothetical protein C8R46DRAFT_574429 [Mycena filopes]|nr:hypothetical protein C8R46DRAFT_574429 [Mycena filopes]